VQGWKRIKIGLEKDSRKGWRYGREKRRKNGRRKRAYRTKEREWTRLEKERTEGRE